jgi:hypothetical protein
MLNFQFRYSLTVPQAYKSFHLIMEYFYFLRVLLFFKFYRFDQKCFGSFLDELDLMWRKTKSTQY